MERMVQNFAESYDIMNNSLTLISHQSIMQLFFNQKHLREKSAFGEKLIKLTKEFHPIALSLEQFHFPP